jgi:hypothetical protein
MKRGLSAESPKAVRSLRMAVFRTFVKTHVGIGGPELSLKLLPGDQFSLTLEQQLQNPKRLFLQPYFPATFRQFARVEVNLKQASAHRAELRLSALHWYFPAGPSFYRTKSVHETS